MGLKKLLWNDNARELFAAREARSGGGLRAASESRGTDQARKLARGSVAFTSALLFGANESQGLLRTLAQPSPDRKDSSGLGSVFAPAEAELDDPRTNEIFGDYYDSLGRKIE
ncbi:hypothetical protein [uncultured Kushneria sp.]|uniref:hypothetical protein n=1 Tax=uncultured Kushneria sp. TaxID=905033 RepID=UPI0026148648|nr:hypothetical protein [uncultured Kushneria sp.]